MRRFSLFSVTFALASAQINCGHASKVAQGKQVELVNPKVINLASQFNIFWGQAKKLTFEEQVDLYTSLIEEPHQDFFDSFVWTKKDDSTFPARRVKQLQIVFSRIAKNETKITNDFLAFENVLATQIARFRKAFTDAEFPVNCYAVIGGNFLGRAGINPKTKEKVLAFGIDKVADMEVNTDILYSHELFHVYHGIKSNIDSDERMIAQLWAEGLASFVSHELNPNASKKDVFIYEGAAKIGDDQLPRIATLFLSVSNKQAFDPRDDHTYFNWFLSEKEMENLPVMAGYWLGYKVVEALRSQYSLAEMSQWSAEKADQMASSVLKRFAQIQSRP